MKTRLATIAIGTAMFGAPVVPATAVGVPVSPQQAVSAQQALPDRLIGVGNATQVISVIAGGYGATSATVRAFTKQNGRWHEVFGPWSAWIGYAGFAPPGAKREGDGRTPSGSYTFSFFFGIDPDPGVHYRWRPVHSYDYWDDDPSSPRYNEWVDRRYHSAGRSPEPMYDLPSYEDGAAIRYNPNRTPGLGSAIFLHVTHHDATTGCIALPRADVLHLLRWLRPGDHARIIMGTAATVTR